MLRHGNSRATRIPAMGIAFAMMVGSATSGAPPASSIKSDEVVLFYPAFARQDADGPSWRVAVHGSIFEPEEGSLKRAVAVKVLRETLPGELSSQEKEIFDRRVRLLLVDGERGKTIVLQIGSGVFQIGPSGEDGHFRGEIRLSGEQMLSWFGTEQPAGHWATFRAIMRPRDNRVFEGRVLAMAPDGLSVISDIDDTIKVTEVCNRKELLANSFLRPFRAVPEMAEAYRALAERKAAFHYVSASPWQFYPALADFVCSAGFPQGTFHLKSVRFLDSSIANLVGSQQEYKTREIEAILNAFPQRRFVLVGDSGEQDPETYAGVARKHPNQILAIWIRNVSQESTENSRFRAAFQGLPGSRWLLFRDPSELRGPSLRILTQAGQREAKEAH